MEDHKARFFELHQAQLRAHRDAALVRKYPDKYFEPLPWSGRPVPPLHPKEKLTYFLTSPGFLFLLVLALLVLVLVCAVYLLPPPSFYLENPGLLVDQRSLPWDFSSAIKAGTTSSTSPTIP